MSPPRATEPVALDAWKHASVQEVVLQSGAGVVKQRPGTLAQAIRGGRVPNPLLPIAIRVEYEGVNPKDLDPEALSAFEEFKDWYVAETIVEPAISAEDVADLPAGDREQLWLNALHLFDARLSRVLSSLETMRPFREREGSAPAAGDGEGPGGAAE